jgi:hypothetical protein
VTEVAETERAHVRECSDIAKCNSPLMVRNKRAPTDTEKPSFTIVNRGKEKIEK